MENKKLKKVFEFIATMLEDETESSLANIPNLLTDTDKIEPVTKDTVDSNINLPDSLRKLSDKLGLDIEHIGQLIKSIDDKGQFKAYKNLGLYTPAAPKISSPSLLESTLSSKFTDFQELNFLTNELSKYKAKSLELEQKLRESEDNTSSWVTGSSITNTFEAPLIDNGVNILPVDIDFRNGRVHYVHNTSN